MLTDDTIHGQRTLGAIHRPGEVREIRVFATSGKYTALFTDLEWVYEQAIPAIEQAGATAYFTLNPVNASGALHTFVPAFKTTGDRDVLKRTHLLIDLDPKRPSGISATYDEKRGAFERAGAIPRGLKNTLVWPEPILADSGNGYHLIYRIDLPNDPKSRDLIQTCLKAIAHHIGAPEVIVDRSVFNASRITALYGTTKRKGTHTSERPHRKSAILSIPEPFEIVSREKLEALAAWAPTEPELERPEYTGPVGARLDLVEWLAGHDIRILSTRQWLAHNGDTVELLEIPCPFSPEDPHDGTQLGVWQTADGALHAHCFHERCQGYGWRDLRAIYDGRRKKPLVWDDDDDDDEEGIVYSREVILEKIEVK